MTFRILSVGILFAFAAFSPHAKAANESSLNLPMHIDLSGSWAYSTASGQALTNTTKLGQWSAGGTVGALLGGWLLLGVTSDYRVTAQYSAVDSTDGNFSSKRWNILSPTLGFRASGFVAKFDYQTLGDLELRNTTATGSAMKYTGVKGYRASLMHHLAGALHVGAFYEKLSYAKQLDTASGETSLDPKLTTSQLGMNVGLVF